MCVVVLGGVESYCLSSLDTVELGVALEEEFSLTLSDNESEKLVSVPDAVECTFCDRLSAL